MPPKTPKKTNTEKSTAKSNAEKPGELCKKTPNQIKSTLSIAEKSAAIKKSLASMNAEMASNMTSAQKEVNEIRKSTGKKILKLLELQ